MEFSIKILYRRNKFHWTFDDIFSSSFSILDEEISFGGLVTSVVVVAFSLISLALIFELNLVLKLSTK
jgi:hypothetical protein